MDLLKEVQRLWIEKIDPRVVDFPLIQSSYYVPLIIFAYLYFILRCGPRFMKNRQPYSLKTFIKLYNIIQIVANAWLVYDHIDAGLFTNNLQNISCSVVFDYSYDYTSLRLCRTVWYYFLLKILDYVETGIFVLRKKNNQVSGLHIYHHVSTLFYAWIGVRYLIVTPALIGSMLNSFVHMLMYTYYFLASYGPNVQKAIAPMKQWITKIQMVQFIILILFFSHNFLPNCKIMEHWVVNLYIFNLIINFYLFYDFYKKTYDKPKSKI
ncbi:elongation of very long chain fatty acids protein 4-like [Cataglyphis hispanica]|uniref:elongation of very long chain fatty acids protein 4-like n=1 Tax=Cataglyphis hispanica TaxID=1086592 RepID=UPI00217F2E60|nr:elongation of very long chain fatty acids protein 4-like [Cataglyphis hispanica]